MARNEKRHTHKDRSPPPNLYRREIKALAFIILCLYGLYEQDFITQEVPSHQTFTEAKRYARVIFSDHEETFYCPAPYNTEHAHVFWRKGSWVPYFWERAERLEWEHIVPVSEIKRGWPRCVRWNRKRCAQEEPSFAKAEGDLYNLVPTSGDLNAARGNLPFALYPKGKIKIGPCPTLFAQGNVVPCSSYQGWIARTYLYMHKTYPQSGILRKPAQKRLMEIWHKNTPPTAWECEWAKRVERIQHNKNYFHQCH